jgi:hypothetical protein
VVPRGRVLPGYEIWRKLNDMSSVCSSLKLHVAEMSSTQAFLTYVLSTLGNLSADYKKRLSVGKPPVNELHFIPVSTHSWRGWQMTDRCWSSADNLSIISGASCPTSHSQSVTFMRLALGWKSPACRKRRKCWQLSGAGVTLLQQWKFLKFILGSFFRQQCNNVKISSLHC